MKKVKSKYLILSVVIAIGLGLALVVVQNSRLKTNTDVDVSDVIDETTQDQQARQVAVEFKDGQANSDNNLEFYHGENVVLVVTASDRDYTFNLPALGISEVVMQGTTYEVYVRGLGKGTHTFTCNDGCSGEIVISNLLDESDLYN